MLEMTKPENNAESHDSTALLVASHKLVATLFMDTEETSSAKRKNW